MNKETIKKSIAKIEAAYHKTFDERAKETWVYHFSNDDGRCFGLALEKHIATSKWPPTIADIKEIIVAISRPDILPPHKAWEVTYDSLIATGEYDEIPSLPAFVEECIAELGWATLMALVREDKAIIARSAFLDQYDAIYSREREKAMIDKDLYELIEAEREKNGQETKKLIIEAKKRREAHEKLFEKYKSN